MSERILPGQPLYDTLYALMKQEESFKVTYQGEEYKFMEDSTPENPKIYYFVKVGNMTGLSGYYGTISVKHG
jgi:hypothetical protein